MLKNKPIENKAARGMDLEWICDTARKAMLFREYLLLATGDGLDEFCDQCLWWMEQE